MAYFCFKGFLTNKPGKTNMPRTRRSILGNRSYHITHRCYNRDFRFKHAIDRDRYQLRLFETKQKYDIHILDYMITSNHVHLLLWAEDPGEVSEAMRFLQGSAAQDYNLRKKRSGAFWTGRFHTTLIQNGSHLSRCLFYIGLNMVRAGEVKHPAEWKWSGFQKHMDQRKRYLIIEKESLFKCLEYRTDAESFQKWYIKTLESQIKTNQLKREAFWSEAVAVGGKSWIEEISKNLPVRKRDIEKAAPLYIQQGNDNQQLMEEKEIYILKGSKRDQSYLTRLKT